MKKEQLLQSIGFLILGVIIGYNIETTPKVIIEEKPTNNTEIVESQQLNLNNFWAVYDVLKENYFDTTKFNPQIQVNGAIKGLVNSLNDPYSVYMDTQENAAFKQSLEGELEGIGAELSIKKEGLIVINTLKDSPAQKAGLKGGDIIYKIGDEYASDLSLLDAVMKIRGEKGTYISLTILRSDLTEPLMLNIQRDKINIASVEMKEVDPGIYQISIYQFGENTAAEFQYIVQQLLLKTPKGIILDLRGDGGGYVDAAIDVLSEFVTGKEVAVKIKYRDESQNQIYYTSEKGRLKDLPTVVLIDEASASASEIVAGAIQDWSRGIVIGAKSFGKGSVQELFNLEDGGSLRLTVAKWYTPNDRSIQDLGITPDQIVVYSNENLAEGMDTQLQAAIDELKK